MNDIVRGRDARNSCETIALEGHCWTRDQWSIYSVFFFPPFPNPWFFLKFFMNRHNGSRSDRIIECTYCYTRAITSRNLMTLIPPADEWPRALLSSLTIDEDTWTKTRSWRKYPVFRRSSLCRIIHRLGYDSKSSGYDNVTIKQGGKEQTCDLTSSNTKLNYFAGALV